MEKKPKLEKVWGEIVNRTWKDEAFKQKLLKDPKQALKEYNIDIPPGMIFKFVEAPTTTKLVHLPPKPDSVELSDECLKEVAGGWTWGDKP